MNCQAWEERVALHAGGDLVAADVTEHLAECAACRKFAEEMRAAIREWGTAIEVPIAALDEVRGNVLEQTRPRRYGWWIAAAAAAAVVVLAVMPMWRMPEVETLALVAPAVPRAPEVHRSLAAPVPTIVASKPVEPVASIKIFTEDPNVVILLVNSEGGVE
jgi:predicted anti-sigma-YlaC factor YlaD